MKSQEDYDLQLIRPGADNIVSVLYAGKTKKGFGKRINSHLIVIEWNHHSQLPLLVTPIVCNLHFIIDFMINCLFFFYFSSPIILCLAPNNPKKRNQDSFIMQHDVKTSSLVIACFDGHGQFGHDVSRFCKIFMERELVSHHLFLSDLHQAILDVTAQLGEYVCSAQIDIMRKKEKFS